jgi:hypothetical protein
MSVLSIYKLFREEGKEETTRERNEMSGSGE